MNLRDWLAERQENAENLARLRPDDREGWLEDADYFRRAVEGVDELNRLKLTPVVPGRFDGKCRDCGKTVMEHQSDMRCPSGMPAPDSKPPEVA